MAGIPVSSSPLDGDFYTWPDLCRRLRWGGRAQRQALANGLRTIRFAGQRYVARDDLVQFFRSLAEAQTSNGESDDDKPHPPRASSGKFSKSERHQGTGNGEGKENE